MKDFNAIKELLIQIYGKNNGTVAFEKVIAVIKKFPVKKKLRDDLFSGDDLILITYADSLKKTGEMPLRTLHRFASEKFKDIFSTIHILPFYPFSSDDGFSVMDFFSVDPDVGSWENIKSLRNDFKLMVDLVLNHISSKSKWFEKYLEEEEGYKDLAVEVDPSTDLSMVTRPRSLPLLTRVKKKSGKTVHVWTTFSADQIDLNYKSPDILIKMIEALLFYVAQGAGVIRLDAIAYLWKEIGTSCVHLEQTHAVVRLFREILNITAPGTLILTETNVPHHENISYFGDGNNEAQMVYNFTLPPLLLYTFIKEDARIFSEWAGNLKLNSTNTTFFNFTASHDGIGVRPLEGILSPDEIAGLVAIVKKNGGSVSYKRNADNTESPYELNITYIDALMKENNKPDKLLVKRFLASQAICLVMPGVPAVYIHSLLGSRNWQEGVRQTKTARTINRAKLDFDMISKELSEPGSFRSRIFSPYATMCAIRRKQQAFHPNAGFEVVDITPKVFGVKRVSGHQMIIALTNISSENVRLTLPDTVPSLMTDLISGNSISSKTIDLAPYQFAWLTDNVIH